MHPSLEPYVTQRVLILNQNVPAREAARAMHERGSGSAVIIDSSGNISGIVTDRDLSSQVLAFGDSPEADVAEFMTTDPITVPESATLDEALEAMESNGIRRVPVVQRGDSNRERCVGIVCLDDLIAHQKVGTAQLARIVIQQTRPRRRTPDSLRSVNRHEQTLNHFYGVLSRSTYIDRSRIEMLASYVLSAIIQWLPATRAAHFVAQMPELLQEDLLSLKAGPDPQINREALVAGVMSRFQLTHEESTRVLRGFIKGLEELTSASKELQRLKASLM